MSVCPTRLPSPSVHGPWCSRFSPLPGPTARRRNSFVDQLRRSVIRNEGIPGGLALLAVAPDPLTCEHSTVTWEMREEICLLTAGRPGPDASTTRTRRRGSPGMTSGPGREHRCRGRRRPYLAEQILFAVREPEIARPGERSATASVGIAMPEPRTSAEQLQNNAAVAMYLARTGGGTVSRSTGNGWRKPASSPAGPADAGPPDHPAPPVSRRERVPKPMGCPGRRYMRASAAATSSANP